MADNQSRDLSDAERIEEAGAAQREATRRLSLEDRFRQNDSMSRFRTEAIRSRPRRQT